MIKLFDGGAYLVNGNDIVADEQNSTDLLKNKFGKVTSKEDAVKNTMAYSILEKHNISGNMNILKIKFDSLATHDITFVGIIQTAKASGLTEFPLPCVFTNCHNSLCAIGGTINEDDHVFGLSAAKKYGGIYVPPHIAVIHQYMRECMSSCGSMILGSDSHTRYGALGTMAIGEGGPELVKQLLNKTYDLNYPKVIGIYLTGKPRHGVGPHDIALAIIKSVYKNSYAKNSVMEFIGDGIKNLSIDFRNGIDVMTTETTCLSSIWETDEIVYNYYKIHNRPQNYKSIAPKDIAYYDGMVHVDMSEIKPMIALPFHPSNAYTIDEFNENLDDILAEVESEGSRLIDVPGVKLVLRDKITEKGFLVEQGIIAGCAGGSFENVCDASDILASGNPGNDIFSLNVYPQSQPVFQRLADASIISGLMTNGAVIKTAFCGPCFGAGDTPSNNGISIRHTTRNFPNREGSRPLNGQISSVALMDARSIAATAANGGILTSAEKFEGKFSKPEYIFNEEIYKKRVYNGYKNSKLDLPLKYGPNIADWPQIKPLKENLLIKVISIINDPVTTTDEIIPSGETSSFRSNPLKLAEFTFSRKDPSYVLKAKAVLTMENESSVGNISDEFSEIFEKIKESCNIYLSMENTTVGSTIYANKPGDGSAREQAASCQRVLGASANIAHEYATKRYRSNLINWGMLPFIIDGEPTFMLDDYIFIPNIKDGLIRGDLEFDAFIVSKQVSKIRLKINELTKEEADIIINGCLMNYYANARE